MVNRPMTMHRILLLLLVLASAMAARAEVSARVDREQLSLNESLQLTLRITGSLNADAPDVQALEHDFEILERRRSSSLSIGSGQRESATEWQFMLAPRRSGRLQIPPLTVSGESSNAIEITVDADSPAAAGNGDIRLEVRADVDELHVQQQLLLSVRVLHAVDLNRGATLEPLSIDGALVSELGDSTYTTTIEGRRFAVFERRYAVFPQKSGELLIPSLKFSASVGGGGGWFDQFGSRAIRLRSQEKRLRVLPPVDQATPWLPARVLTLIETWDKDPQDLQVGDSATRTITLSAQGLSAAQLPPIPMESIDGLRFYPDQPRLEDAPQKDGVTGTRSESAAVIPERAGTLVLPAIKLRWWSTVDQRFATAMIPERTIEIRAASAAGSAAPPARLPAATDTLKAAPETHTPPEDSGSTAQPGAPRAPLPWMIATIVFALGMLFAGWRWWRAVQQLRTPPLLLQPATTAAPPNEGAAFSTLRAACSSADPGRIHTALYAWGVAAFPGHALHSAGDVVAATQDAALASEFRQLLMSAYGATQSRFDAAALLSRVEVQRTRLHTGKEARASTTALPPLYAQR